MYTDAHTSTVCKTVNAWHVRPSLLNLSAGNTVKFIQCFPTAELCSRVVHAHSMLSLCMVATFWRYMAAPASSVDTISVMHTAHPVYAHH